MNGVSRETLLLRRYEALVEKWQPAVQLVAADELRHFASRHVADCEQLLPYVTSPIVDLGAGGGLPSIVLAIYGHSVTAIESDKRKAAFLRVVASELELPLTVRNERAESVSLSAKTVTARALADLKTLLHYSLPFCSAETQCVFPKGAKWDTEVAKARQQFDFALEAVPSEIHPEGRILLIRNISRRG